jgi:malonyl-CoA O-methyltransferase
MPTERPPTIDPTAAARWRHAAPAASPWLHEEVARRMEDRLQWITRQPDAWGHWDAMRGGSQAHALLTRRFPAAACTVVESDPRRIAAARAALRPSWWKPAAWRAPELRFADPDDAALQQGGLQMLWANMALHLSADPQALIARWHRALDTDGYLMFSCLGPDTAQEVRALYRAAGWPPAGHAFTDMHDWGDMLVHAGFAEPIMDMERIVLTFATPQRLLQELREIGRNLHPDRFGALRGRGWRARLESAIGALPRQPDGSLALTFEIIYGHAFKPAPRVRLSQESAVSLRDMRTMLRRGRPGDPSDGGPPA